MSNTEQKSNRFTENDYALSNFIQIPDVLVTSAKYEKLSPRAILAYGLLKSRFSLSLQNGWKDQYQQIYFVFTNKELAKKLNKTEDTAKNIRKQLIDFGLLESERQWTDDGRELPSRLYLLKPTNEPDETSEIPEKSENKGGKNYTPQELANVESVGGGKITPRGEKKLHTNYIKNNHINFFDDEDDKLVNTNIRAHKENKNQTPEVQKLDAFIPEWVEHQWNSNFKEMNERQRIQLGALIHFSNDIDFLDAFNKALEVNARSNPIGYIEKIVNQAKEYRLNNPQYPEDESAVGNF